jgi:hypothetical protein
VCCCRSQYVEQNPHKHGKAADKMHRLSGWIYIGYCRAYGDYIRRVLDWQLDLLDHNQLHNSVTVYFTLQLTTTESLLFLWRPRLQLLQPTLMASLAITSHNWLGIVRSWLSTSELYSPGTDHKENTVSDSSTVVWRHCRNGPQRKQEFLPLLRCLATVVNKRFHRWLLTYSVHVTL